MPEVDKTLCEERKTDRWYLAPDRFAAWLGERDLSEGDFAPISWFACAFAILQPENAAELCQVLADRDEAFFASAYLPGVKYNAVQHTTEDSLKDSTTTRMEQAVSVAAPNKTVSKATTTFSPPDVAEPV